MYFLKRVLPNLSISLNLALITLVILDWFNPKLGFLSGLQFHVLFGACALSSILVACVLYGWSRKKRRKTRYKHHTEAEEL